ncbi:MAG: hypothetical protein ACRCTP_04480 [Aeromonas popoffii]|uniref:hypothetical protein n=1 Tax=Aeromonas popoffii TaxID=70856 RepID=UPI003F3D17A2
MYHKKSVSLRERTFVVGLDVDLTMFDSLTPWLEWAGISYDQLPVPERDEALDLAPFMEKMGVKDPLSFWKDPSVYWLEGVTPLNPKQRRLVSGISMFLSELRGAILDWVDCADVKFIVVSSCFPEHETAKWNLIDARLGSTIDAKISTSAKHHVDFDLIIDDSMGVALNCIRAGKPVWMVPSPLANPSPGSLATGLLAVLPKEFAQLRAHDLKALLRQVGIV